MQCTQIFVGDIDLETEQVQELHGISFLWCVLQLGVARSEMCETCYGNRPRDEESKHTGKGFLGSRYVPCFFHITFTERFVCSD